MTSESSSKARGTSELALEFFPSEKEEDREKRRMRLVRKGNSAKKTLKKVSDAKPDESVVKDC